MLNQIIHCFSRVVLNSFFKLFFKFKAYGLENIPVRGPVIFAANHESFMDGLLLMGAIPQPICFILTSKYRINRVLANIFQFLLVDADIRRKAVLIKKTLRVLKSGRSLAMFPEGRIRRIQGKPMRPKQGVGLIAKRGGVPIIPVTIIGGRDILTPGKRLIRFFQPTRVILGEPIYPKDKEISEIAHRVMHQIFAQKELALQEKVFRKHKYYRNHVVTRYPRQDVDFARDNPNN